MTAQNGPPGVAPALGGADVVPAQFALDGAPQHFHRHGDAGDGDGQVIVLATKADQPGFAVPELEGALALSSVTGQGLEELEREIAARFPEGGSDGGEILTSQRQAEAVQRAAQCLEAVFEGMERGMTPDAVLSDVELALDALGEVTGRVVKDDVTERIFERFCVGK